MRRVDYLDHGVGGADGPKYGEMAACGVLEESDRGVSRSRIAFCELHTLQFDAERPQPRQARLWNIRFGGGPAGRRADDQR